MSRLFVCGDTHGSYDLGKLDVFATTPVGKSLTKDDYVVQLGDWGGYWSETPGGIREQTILNRYSRYPWTTLVIDGNHDNHVRLQAMKQIDMFGGKVSEIIENVFYLRRSQVLEINDKKIFVMGGGYSVDKHTRIAGESWWHQEIPSDEEFELANSALKAVDYKVDYVFTHSPPRSIIDSLTRDKMTMRLHPNIEFKARYEDGCSIGLQKIYDQIEFKEWHCGHMHVDIILKPKDDEYFHLHYNNPPYEIKER